MLRISFQGPCSLLLLFASCFKLPWGRGRSWVGNRRLPSREVRVLFSISQLGKLVYKRRTRAAMSSVQCSPLICPHETNPEDFRVLALFSEKYINKARKGVSSSR